MLRVCLDEKSGRAGLKSVVMTRNTVVKDGQTIVQSRFFISSLSLGVAQVARAIRGHWMVESVFWHLDVTFHEDDDRTVDKVVACNLNILRKLALNILRLVDVGKKKAGIAKKRNMIGWNLPKYLEQILTI
jgi:predicted transposase YbfD/YdcC